jgi:hypothetical protein
VTRTNRGIEGNAIEANKTQKTTISNKADKKRIKELEEELNRAGSRYFCESLFWASQPKQAAKT